MAGDDGKALTLYVAAARDFAALTHRIPRDRWDGPGLGQWNLRSLVGHTSRALTTVITYLETRAVRQDITSAEDYFGRAIRAGANIGPSDILERGRRAGEELGDQPASAVDQLVRTVLDKLAHRDNDLITVIGGLGIRLFDYLPTRTFELAVHSVDIAEASGVGFSLTPGVLESATVLTARVAVAMGQGEVVLRALTGRSPLPSPFSVVP